MILGIFKWKKAPGGKYRQVFFLLAASFLLACIAYYVNAEIFGSGKEIMNHSLFTDDK